jgi:hypothetical protein
MVPAAVAGDRAGDAIPACGHVRFGLRVALEVPLHLQVYDVGLMYR